MAIQVVILAAGQGKRMSSNLPKMLHPLAGKPLLEHVVSTAWHISPAQPPVIVYGYQGDMLRKSLAHLNAHWIEQKEQLGTGHALLQAMGVMLDEDHVLVLYGDAPLISRETLKKLIDATPKEALGLVTAHLPNPDGYGRIKRNEKQFITGIVEEKDATPDERHIKEINPGIYLAPAKYLKKWLPKLQNKNAQQEYYMTDIISLSIQDHIPILDVQPVIHEEILGVNDRVQLAYLERIYQRQYAEKLMRQGVTIYDPARLDIRGDVQIGHDVIIDVNVIFEGRVVIGNECTIGPHTIIRNSMIGDRVEIKANSMIDGAEISAGCIIGPFARIRPGTVLAREVHVGNFVEIKNSTVGGATKINHLSYVGDSEIGKQVNIGAGTITCNYDGYNKHKTIIGDYVQVGSDTQLVAPVRVGEGAVLGAGSTVTKDVPPQQLTLTHRLEQRSMQRQLEIKKKENV